MRRYLMRMWALLTPGRAEDELAREIDAHLALLQEDFERRGLPPEQARVAARRAFGNVETIKARHRETRSLPVIESTLFDLRVAVRAVVRSPGFSSITISLIALGVAATTTLFSLTYGVLLKPLPWANPDRVVRLQETRGGKPGRIPWTITNTTYHAWRDDSTTIEAIGGWFRTRLTTVTIGGGTPERLGVARLTAGLFPALGVPPVVGRVFSDEEANSAAGVMVLGFSAWQRRFGGGTDVVGQTLVLDNRIFTIVGVMPAHFAVPDREAEAWIPFRVPRVEQGSKSISAMLFNAVARLRPEATPAQAAAEATARGRAAPTLLEAGIALFGSADDITVAAVPARDAMTSEVKPPLVMLLAAVGLLFVTAVASVLVLQSSRAVRRRRDMAVRAAVGAGTARLALGWLLESAVLGVLGGTGGIVLSLVFHRMLPVVLPPDFPRIDDVVLDVRVAFFAAGLTLLATILVGLVPAIQARDHNLQASLSTAVGSGMGGKRQQARYLQAGMILTQVAIACVLLVGTGLLARTFVALLSADRGFDPQHVIAAYATQPPRPFAGELPLLERARDRLRGLPGVTDVAIANALPFVTLGGLRGIDLPSPDNPGVKMQVQTVLRVVSPEYFAAMGLRIIAGRPFERSDTSASRPVVIVNKTFAAQYLQSRPVGSTISAAVGYRDDRELVGIVDDMRQGGLRGVTPSAFGGVADPPQPEMFLPSSQWEWEVGDVVYVVRSTGDPSNLAPVIRDIISKENPSLSMEGIATMEDLVLDSLARPRTYALLLAGFALFSTAVALVGLFGVLSHLAAQRSREIGVRTALGATPVDILTLVTREAFAIAVCGVVIGLLAASMLARWLATMLYGVNAHDLTTFVAVPAFLILAATLACSLPAYRAARTSPVTALRSS